jgi:hypothetical protein
MITHNKPWTETDQERAKQNKIRLNIDKAKHMIINQTTAGPANIIINNNLEQVETYKYL